MAKISAAGNFFGCTGTGAEMAALADEEEWASSVTTEVREESMERLRRLRSARSSAAVWQRMSRSFSKDLLMISSSFVGTSGTRRVAAVG